MKRLVRGIGALLVIAVLGGCTARMGDLSIVANQNIDMDHLERYEAKGARAEGTDTTHLVLFFPIGSASVEEALDDAVASVPGAVGLTDATLRYSWWWLFYYGQTNLTIEGTPLIDTKQVISAAPTEE